MTKRTGAPRRPPPALVQQACLSLTRSLAADIPLPPTAVVVAVAAVGLAVAVVVCPLPPGMRYRNPAGWIGLEGEEDEVEAGGAGEGVR